MARPNILLDILRAQILETPYHLSWATQLATQNEDFWGHRHIKRVLAQIKKDPEITRFQRLIMPKKSETKRKMPEWIYRPAAYTSFENEFKDMREARRNLRNQAALLEIGAWGEEIAREWLECATWMSPARSQVTASGRAALGAKEHSFDFLFEYLDRFGLEVKNEMAPLKLPELQAKLDLAKTMNVRPLFLVRRLERSHVKLIADANGMAIQWGVQFVPYSLRKPAEFLANQYGLPIRVGRPTSLELLESAWRFVEARLLEEMFDSTFGFLNGAPARGLRDTPEDVASLVTWRLAARSKVAELATRPPQHEGSME